MTLIDYSTADVLTILSRVKSEPSDKIENETIEFKEFSSESSLHGSKELAEEICGTKEGILLRIKDNSVDFFNLDKTIKPPPNSDKFVKLFFMLKNING